MHLVEQVGSGIPRMCALMKEMNLSEPTFGKEGMFTITFIRDKKNVGLNVGINVGKEILFKLSENQKLIIQILKEDPFLTAHKLSVKMSLSKRSVERLLKKISDLGIIKREGSRKDGHWVILK